MLELSINTIELFLRILSENVSVVESTG